MDGNNLFLAMMASSYQPYFAPFPGFFAKALLSDVFVLMDSVQFPQGTTWLTRNRFKNDQGTLWLTIPVWKKGLGLQQINQVRICHEGRWKKKHLASLRTAYAHSPFFDEHEAFVESLFQERTERLLDLNLKIIRYLMGTLGGSTRLVLLSELGIRGKEPELTLSICKELGVTQFLAQQGARKYLDRNRFQKENIELVFFRSPSPVYPQLWGRFLPNLSTMDLLFNCGPKTRNYLMNFFPRAGGQNP